MSSLYKTKINLIKSVAKLWALFLDLIFPIECAGCSKDGEWLCEDCFKKISLNKKQYCLHCKKENNFGEFCPACSVQYDINGVWIASSYDEEVVAELIKNLKYRFVKEIAGGLSKILILFLTKTIKSSRIASNDLVDGLDWRRLNLVKNLPQVVLNFKDCLVVPVPLSKKRRRWRGFNQAETLARELANVFDLKIDTTNLVKIKHRKPQARLGEKDRKVNLINCFFWQGENLQRRHIILVDDVVTTGSTLNECAKVLKRAGAGEVWGLVVAKG